MESNELRDLKNEEAAKPRTGDIVIEKETGDIGMVTEMDNTGRTTKVTFRNGSRVWFVPEALYVV